MSMRPRRKGKHPGGRPTKFEPKTCELIVQSVRLGAPWELAPLRAGVDYTTFRKWIQRGQAEKTGPYREFFEAIKRAEGEAVVRRLVVIERSANSGTWQAAAWLLERRYPQIFGRTVVTSDAPPAAAPASITAVHNEVNIVDMAALMRDPARLRQVAALARELGLEQLVLEHVKDGNGAGGTGTAGGDGR